MGGGWHPERRYTRRYWKSGKLLKTRFKLEGSCDFKIDILQIRNLFTDHKEKCPKFLEQ